jgi:hypothetical protein
VREARQRHQAAGNHVPNGVLRPSKWSPISGAVTARRGASSG